jgi:hypothetical protein
VVLAERVVAWGVLQATLQAEAATGAVGRVFATTLLVMWLEIPEAGLAVGEEFVAKIATQEWQML